MFPSEAEIEARLVALRARRDALDREIADLALYRELGRRLGAAGLAGGAAAAPPPPMPEPSRRSWPPCAPPHPDPDGRTGLEGTRFDLPFRDLPFRDAPPADGRAPDLPVPPAAFEDDPVAARRYGRALIEAAVGVLAAAGRPMHAGEILERLAARGFTLPGQDPVAALNTRLWKRSGPGGPVRRMGDAVYALTDG